MQWNFSDLKNPRFIIESGFKSRAGYIGARTVIVFNLRYQFRLPYCTELIALNPDIADA